MVLTHAFKIGLTAGAFWLAAAEAGNAASQQCGNAAWFDLDGTTASGERADSSKLTAAHRTLPFQTKVKVENLDNGRAVIVRVNDRGPYTKGRVIDVSKAAAEQLGFLRAGTANVRLTVVDGPDTRLDRSCSLQERRAPEGRIVTASAAPAAAAPAPEPAPVADTDTPVPRIKPSTVASLDPDEVGGDLPDPGDIVIADPPEPAPEAAAAMVDGLNLPDRFANAFAATETKPDLLATLTQKAETEPVVAPPADPHHGTAKREPWDRLQQVPQ